MLYRLSNVKTPGRIVAEVALVIVIAISSTISSIIAYAIVSSWINGDRDIIVEIGDMFSGHMEQIDVAGNVSFGDTVKCIRVYQTPEMCKAWVSRKQTYPVIIFSGFSIPIYTWMVNDGWNIVEERSDYTVYDYTPPLAYGGNTSELCDGMVLKDMPYEELLGIGNININIGYCLGNCNDAGEDVDVAWSQKE